MSCSNQLNCMNQQLFWRSVQTDWMDESDFWRYSYMHACKILAPFTSVNKATCAKKKKSTVGEHLSLLPLLWYKSSACAIQWYKNCNELFCCSSTVLKTAVNVATKNAFYIFNSSVLTITCFFVFAFSLSSGMRQWSVESRRSSLLPVSYWSSWGLRSSPFRESRRKQTHTRKWLNSNKSTVFFCWYFFV